MHSQKATTMNHSPQDNSTGAVSIPEHNSRTALVLGGGGSTGNAWLIGVVAGFLDADLDVTAADVIIGTSAGSTAAAQIAGESVAELFAATVAGVPQKLCGSAGLTPRRPHNRPVVSQLEKTDRIIASAADASDMRRRMGAAALDMLAASDGTWQTQWRATVASRLPSQHWPEQTVLIAAVQATTGEPAVFDRHNGVDLADAIAASSASFLPTESGTATTSTAATGATRTPIWPPDTGGFWCCRP
jgi:NTE family protein